MIRSLKPSMVHVQTRVSSSWQQDGAVLLRVPSAGE